MSLFTTFANALQVQKMPKPHSPLRRQLFFFRINELRQRWGWEPPRHPGWTAHTDGACPQLADGRTLRNLDWQTATHSPRPEGSHLVKPQLYANFRDRLSVTAGHRSAFRKMRRLLPHKSASCVPGDPATVQRQALAAVASVSSHSSLGQSKPQHRRLQERTPPQGVSSRTHSTTHRKLHSRLSKAGTR